ncbi:formate dehydrogenase subunit gamma [Hahella sp. CCB-MM4]|uniref:formate dehydrogenase subunit gamma n=1 Tax=Hahella sp. (strain CCB-MM4) TaxID=1926491 RepID=UPI000B9C4D4C|nr:formate dehydrogenase subunit gamma [Hahella sp. CCB-MM4]OZG70084.1 formate dehydrogenase subunit gamma [Hahella sp. CCB-MM4]
MTKLSTSSKAREPDFFKPGISDSAEIITGILMKLKHKPGALLPILHAIQDQLGYIPAESVPQIAEALGQTRAEIHGVISFYHEFRSKPGGTHHVQICRAEACQARGSRELEAHAKKVLGVEYHNTTADQEITLEPVYCLGNCACGPSVRVDNKIFGRVTPARFDRMVDELTTSAVNIVGLEKAGGS